MQVGDALVGVHHIHRRTFGGHGVDGGHDGGLVLDPVQQVAQAGIGVHTQFSHFRAVLLEHRGQPGFDRVAKDDRVGHLHHRGLHMQREQHAFGLGLIDLVGQEGVQSRARHKRCVHNGAGGIGHAVLQHSFAIGRFQNDFGRCGLIQRRGFFVREEIIAGHRGNARFAIGAPVAHAVRVVLGEFLDGGGGAAVRVAFAQNRVHGRAFDPVIFGAHGFFRVGFRGFGVIGDCETLGLQFLHSRDQLRDRSRDVRQFDHIGLGRFHQIPQFGQIVGDPLIVGQAFGEGGKDTTGKRDVLGAHCDVGSGCKSLNDRQERAAGKLGRLVHFGIDNVGIGFSDHW